MFPPPLLPRGGTVSSCTATTTDRQASKQEQDLVRFYCIMPTMLRSRPGRATCIGPIADVIAIKYMFERFLVYVVISEQWLYLYFSGCLA